MKYFKGTILVILLSLLVMPNNAFSGNRKVSIIKKGGKSTECGISYHAIIHNTDSNTETIKCTGRGPNICPEPVHCSKKEIAKIEKQVTKGFSKGKILDVANLTIMEFSKGKISKNKLLKYKATIIIFDTIEEYNEYLEN